MTALHKLFGDIDTPIGSARGIRGFPVGIVYSLGDTFMHVCYNLLELGICCLGSVWPILLQGFLGPCANIVDLFIFLMSSLLCSCVCHPGRGDTSCVMLLVNLRTPTLASCDACRLLLDLFHLPALQDYADQGSTGFERMVLTKLLLENNKLMATLTSLLQVNGDPQNLKQT